MRYPKGKLTTQFSGFPGVRIPLLSDEQCKARGIEKPRLPPFESWMPEQQEAGRTLSDILSRIAVRQAAALVLRHVELMLTEGYTGPDPEREAARRALRELRAGKWKPGKDDVNGLQGAMSWALEALAGEANSRGNRTRFLNGRTRATP